MDSGAVTPGVPAEYEPIVTLIIAWAAAWLVQPLTALAKKWGCTTGPTTVMVSAALSLLVAVGFTLATAAATGGMNWTNALISAVLAWARANGNYVNDVFTAQKANRTAPSVFVQPQPDMPAPAPDPEPTGPQVRVLD